MCDILIQLLYKKNDILKIPPPQPIILLINKVAKTEKFDET